MNEYADAMISFGAGVNSVAMTIMLVEQGWRGPVVMADPGAEHPETYCYVKYFEREYLKPRGMEITCLLPGSEYHSNKASTSLEDYCLRAGVVPFLAMRWCSVWWKRDPIGRWAKDHDIDIQLLGISASEPRRVRDDSALKYPLVEASVNRPECRRVIQRAGLEVPHKSGCWFCPGQRIAEWQRLYHDYPVLYDRAIALEDNASKIRGRRVTLDPRDVSLREHRERRWQGQAQMDLSQWLPCACRL